MATPATDSAVTLPWVSAVAATPPAVIPPTGGVAGTVFAVASSPLASPTRARVSTDVRLSAPAMPTEVAVSLPPVPSALV